MHTNNGEEHLKHWWRRRSKNMEEQHLEQWEEDYLNH